jgi:hypothetical protein
MAPFVDGVIQTCVTPSVWKKKGKKKIIISGERRRR